MKPGEVMMPGSVRRTSIPQTAKKKIEIFVKPVRDTRSGESLILLEQTINERYLNTFNSCLLKGI